MRQELRAIRDAWDKDLGGGREEKHTREMCDRYVAAHPEQFEKLRTMTLDELVQSVSVFRAAGWEEEQWLVEVWLLHHFEPQNIGGTVEARVRLPGAVN
jgi:hypothetical protein